MLLKLFHFSIAFIFLFVCLNGQSTISATYASVIPTNFGEGAFDYDDGCNGSALIYINFPNDGSSYKVTNVNTSYTMIAENQGFKAEQFSSIVFVNNNTAETTEAQGVGFTEGTQAYNRSINLANGVYPSGAQLVFQLRARRSQQVTGQCNSEHNYVQANTWQITVSFAKIGKLGIGINSPTKGILEVYGVNEVGKNSAAFGSMENGISLQRSPASIGFNEYDDHGVPTIMHNDLSGNVKSLMSLNGYFRWSGNAMNDGLVIDPNGMIGLGVTPISTTSLTVGINNNQKVNFYGSSQVSYFGSSVAINGGKDVGKVYINDVPNGKVIIKGRSYYGTVDYGPNDAAMHVNGALAFTKRSEHEVCNGGEFQVGNASYVNVTRVGCNVNKAFTLSNGLVDGQLLIVQIEGNNDFKINDTNNVNIAGNLTPGGGDILVLIWHQNMGKWLQISYSNN